MALVNLYLTGHGITWQNKAFNWHLISMSFLDLVLLLAVGATLVGVPILVLRNSAGASRRPK